MRDPISNASILAIEQHSARAWPAPINVPMRGWVMRFAPNSSSKRVNSLNPVAPELDQFRAVLKAYLTECDKRNCAAHVRLLPLARQNEREILTSFGVHGMSATSVDCLDYLSSDFVDDEVILSDALSDDWLDAYADAHGYGADERAAIRAILQTVPHVMGFAHILENGIPVAAGRAVLIDGLAGFFQIATAPSARRKGYAKRIMNALIGFASGHGATRGYLQVEMRNTPARSLYASLGFKPLYSYDYWSVPTSIATEALS